MGGLPTPADLDAAVMVAMRISGLVLVAPVLSARSVSMRVKTVLIVMFTILLWPAAAASAGGARLGAGSFLTEWIVGMSLGLGAMILVAAAESAGDVLAIQMGLSGGNVVNPMSDSAVPVVGQFLGLMVVTLLVSTGGHVLMLSTLARSLEIVPPGSGIALREGALAVVDLGSQLFLLGLRVAAPVVAAVMVGNAVLGVLARTVPQLNVLMVAFPLQIAIGLATLAVTLPFIAMLYGQWPMLYEQIVEGLMRGFGGVLPGADAPLAQGGV